VWKLNNEMPHLQQYSLRQYETAKYISDYCVMLPTYVDMTKEDVKRVCDLIEVFYYGTK